MSTPIRSPYYHGTRSEAEVTFWRDHWRKDIIPSSVQVHRARDSMNTWYITYRPTRSAMRRWGFLEARA